MAAGCNRPLADHPGPRRFPILSAQLIRNDARPHRWVALQQDKRAWDLFWAGGDLQHMRQLLSDPFNAAEGCSALVALSPDALLRLALDLESQGPSTSGPHIRQPSTNWRGQGTRDAWELVAWTSLAWLVVLRVTVAGFWNALERQDRKLKLLIERPAPSRIAS